MAISFKFCRVCGRIRRRCWRVALLAVLRWLQKQGFVDCKNLLQIHESFASNAVFFYAYVVGFCFNLSVVLLTCAVALWELLSRKIVGAQAVTWTKSKASILINVPLVSFFLLCRSGAFEVLRRRGNVRVFSSVAQNSFHIALDQNRMLGQVGRPSSAVQTWRVCLVAL